MLQISKKRAVYFYENGFLLMLTDNQIVRFQLFQKRLCVPFELFHAACERVLGRPISSISLGSQKIKDEYLANHTMPTYREIMLSVGQYRSRVSTPRKTKK